MTKNLTNHVLRRLIYLGYDVYTAQEIEQDYSIIDRLGPFVRAKHKESQKLYSFKFKPRASLYYMRVAY